MPSGRWPERVKAFRKWATDQVERGTVAGNSVTSSKRKTPTWRRKRRKRKKNRGFQD